MFKKDSKSRSPKSQYARAAGGGGGGSRISNIASEVRSSAGEGRGLQRPLLRDVAVPLEELHREEAMRIPSDIELQPASKEVMKKIEKLAEMVSKYKMLTNAGKMEFRELRTEINEYIRSFEYETLPDKYILAITFNSVLFAHCNNENMTKTAKERKDCSEFTKTKDRNKTLLRQTMIY
jgi:hypothetical protein